MSSIGTDRGAQRKGRQHRRRMTWLLLVLALLAALAAVAFYHGLITRPYTISSSRLTQPLRIVLLSDLHSAIHGAEQRDLLQRIEAAQPDLILMAGDIVDDILPIRGSELLLAGIAGICPVYYVTGNHEFWAEDIEAIRDLLRGHGVHILEDAYEEIELNGNRLLIAGIDDPDKTSYEDAAYDQEQSMAAAFGSLGDSESYRILLAHRPERIEFYTRFGFDLILSGHAHGGQVRLPFLLNGLYAPNQGFFPPYAGGLYQHGELVHIVGRGLSYNPRLPRIFNPPEVVVIDLIPEP